MIRRSIAAALLSMMLIGASPPSAPSKDERPLLLAFGDSLTAGYGLDQGLGFAPQLQATLRRHGIKAEVVDGGVSGDTTDAGKGRLGWTLDGMSRKPDLVILELGANDMLRGLNPTLTEANLDAMLAELNRRGIPVLVAGMRAAPNLDPGYIKRFEAIYPSLAATPWCVDLPLLPGWSRCAAGHGAAGWDASHFRWGETHRHRHYANG